MKSFHFNIFMMCLAPLYIGAFTEHGGVQHFIQLHHQVQLAYGLGVSYAVYVNMYSEFFRGFSDSLLASRQLYTEAPSHKLSAMLAEVGWQFGF